MAEDLEAGDFVVEYAKTGRSGCKLKACASKTINKGDVRVGKVAPSPFDPDKLAIAWCERHRLCVWLRG